MIAVVRNIIIIFIVWIGQLFQTSTPHHSATKQVRVNTTTICVTHEAETKNKNTPAKTEIKIQHIRLSHITREQYMALHKANAKKFPRSYYCETCPPDIDTIIDIPSKTSTKSKLAGHS